MSIKELIEKYKLEKIDLLPFLPLEQEILLNSNLEVLHLPDFINYNPQNNYYFAKEKTGFEVNPDGRTEGTYTKYQSLDDKLDGLHYYTWFIKTGRGRATEDAALEVRNKIITREEAVSLVKKFDGEFPDRYFNEIMDYLDIKKDIFFKKSDKFRSPHLWKKKNNSWKLRFTVY